MPFPRSSDAYLMGRPTDRIPYGFADYLYPGLTITLGADAPDLAAFRGNISAYAFAGTGGVTEQGFFSIHLLHDIKQGTAITFHVHWGHIIGAPSGDVKWQIEYSIARGYSKDAFPAATTLSVTQTAGAQYAHHITDDDSMTIAAQDAIEPDALILGRVFRDPADVADTFENDAYLFHLDMHYEQGQLGTTERNRPFLSAGFSS